jgi:glycosyltransferase involved in cell wall biosynthesis
MLDLDTPIFFILLSRFPTDKAYGVTTEHSAKAVYKLGYKTYVITPISDSSKVGPIFISVIGHKIYEYLLNRELVKFLRLRFNSFLFFYLLLIRQSLKEKRSVLWCRDIYFSLLLSMMTNNLVICEVHKKPYGFQKICLKIISLKSNVIIAPIGNFITQDYRFHEKRFAIAHMAINSSELMPIQLLQKQKIKKIVYVGHIESSGVQIDTNILNEAAHLIHSMHPNWVFEIIGIEPKDFNKDLRSNLARNVKILGLVPRHMVLSKLTNASIGLSIYPESKVFDHSFPIKIVEYAAMNVSIVASETVAHTNILDESRCIMFKDNSINALAIAIDKLIRDDLLRNSIAINARMWVEKLTYENRVLNILKLFDV